MKINTFFEEEKGFEIPTEGQHPATVVNITEGTSKKGNDMVIFDLVIGKYKLKYYCVSTVGMNWGLKRVIHALLGSKPPSGSVSFDTDKLIGRTLVVDIEHESWDDKTRAKIKDIIIPKNENAPVAEPF